MAQRDDFTQATRNLLARRAGFLCSKPDCLAPTVGASASDPDKAVDMGMAAHITAAAPGGPRHDKTITREQRRSADNGIWTCVQHGTLIDKDEASYSVATLREWKRVREEAAANALARAGGQATEAPSLQLGSFWWEEDARQSWEEDGRRYGECPGMIVLEGRRVIGTVWNRGNEQAIDCVAKAAMPNGRSIELPWLASARDINPDDCVEFELGLGGLVRVGKSFFKIAGEVICPVPDELEVEVRVTSSNVKSVRQRLRLQPTTEAREDLDDALHVLSRAVSDTGNKGMIFVLRGEDGVTFLIAGERIEFDEPEHTARMDQAIESLRDSGFITGMEKTYQVSYLGYQKAARLSFAPDDFWWNKISDE